MNHEAYPLDWPETEPRTPWHRRTVSTFKVSLARARDDLFDELRRLGARGVVLSTNMELRRDGLPYAKQRRMDDPGAACFWEVDGQAFAMACDSYTDLLSNVRAIGLTVGALRSIERHGSRSLRDRAFQGFAALPEDAGGDGERPWRDVLSLPFRLVTREAIEDAFRYFARERHPDAGGSDLEMAELNRAKKQALEELDRGPKTGREGEE